MSRAARKQLFSMADLLKRAYKALEGNLWKQTIDTEQLTGLLADSQEVAVSMGTQIEAICGEGTDTVRELENYCETLYQITQSYGNPAMQKELLRQLKQQLGRIRSRIGKDVPDRLEAVFLPYKASMWDSLESIWKAAKEDEEADAYVVPIPYYDRKPGLSLGEEHYEGALFPEDVKITDYHEYSLEMRRPDIVFIHNPYDDGNYVTTVHPHFYSGNLKKYTEKLVYVPYFVCAGEEVPEGMALTKGVCNADYIIVQNENEKEQYIQHFQNRYPGVDISGKLLPLGSPKFDKVRSAGRDDLQIPTEWRQMTEGKKVILYNTSLGGLLNESERYLEKMERVFRFFSKRKDAVLLWRPHPLMESTFSSMRPELYEKFIKLKTQFIQEKYGIYDDTPDMHAAIGLSDAYYGDLSSLVKLYQETGKPVMIQDVKAE